MLRLDTLGQLILSRWSTYRYTTTVDLKAKLSESLSVAKHTVRTVPEHILAHLARHFA